MLENVGNSKEGFYKMIFAPILEPDVSLYLY